MEQLSPAVYQHLKAMAARVHRQNPGSTVSATELVHEAWLKLERSTTELEDTQHYVRVAARAMRQILVDRARSRHALRRGGHQVQTTLSQKGEPPVVLDLLMLDELMSELAEGSERASQVVELRVFGGLTAEEIAENLGVSRRTVTLDWRFARTFLAKRVQEG